MHSTRERGKIELQAQPKEGFVEVIFKQGEKTRFCSVSDELFNSAQLSPRLRNIHAILECLIEEFQFDIDPSKPRKKELLRFLFYLSQSPHEEYRKFSRSLSRFFVDEFTLLILVFVLTLIVVVLLFLFKC